MKFRLPHNALVQLPDDAKLLYYENRGRFDIVALYHSASNNFTGTEREFLDAGLAYAYVQTGKYLRRVLTQLRD